MNIVVCFLSTIKDHFNLKELQKQAKESKLHNVDIYEYIDNNSNYRNDQNTIYFCYEDLKYKFKYHHSWYNTCSPTRDKAGLQFLPLLDMYVNHINEYDAYLFYEDDLSYFGNENLFDRIDFSYDAIFQSHRKLCIESKWSWKYDDFNHKLDDSYIEYYGLLNIYMLKSNILEGLLEFIKTNYYHHECIVSSYVLNNDYTVSYIDDYIKSFFTYLDEVNENNILDNKYELVHPIKTQKIYDNIKSNIK